MFQGKEIAKTTHYTDKYIHRVLNYHTKADGTQKKQEIHQRVTFGKGIGMQENPPLQRKNVPKMGTLKTKINSIRPSPRARKYVRCCIPTPDAFCSSLLGKANDCLRRNVRLRRLGTVGIYPFQCQSDKNRIPYISLICNLEFRNIVCYHENTARGSR